MWDGGPIPEELAKFPGYLLARLGESSRRRFREALEEAGGLHPRLFGVMTMVAAEPGMTQQQLHEKTGIDPSSMVAVIDELEQQRLAERRPHPADRRARTIYLTKPGLQTLARVNRIAEGLQRQLFEPLDAQESRTLHALLRKLAGTPERS
ncbi:MAG TPA: MarR family winged helix-turn-helix transcriptional regulator [Solirubrobacteraceae bacterium]|jgi:DNA-binding MarR family transcriptional regulator